ncbi:coronin-2A [Gadus macrocephalus]|uniref:coronin-2A n=1 Tax=Gadus macrocephalus TaxID=80720 RepID=UPI0028CB3859|nr:coronin-2A [Gadus macrocephalus]
MFCSRLAQVQGKPASRDHCYNDVSITRSVHDNHYCSVNPCFIAVVTECNGGGSFLVLPIHHTGRLDPQQPRVCGHRARVLDVKWSPFNDHQVASCSEDCTVKIWDVPVCGVRQNLTQARKTLIGHSRRVGLIEWHPTAKDLLLSSAYDYKVCLWDVSQGGPVLRCPVRVVVSPLGQPRPAEMLLLCACFSPDGSRLALTSKDRRLRLLDPRTGAVLQVSSPSYRVCKVVYLGALKMLLTTGFSCWNQRQITLWDPRDLSEPLYEEELDGTGGVLFPFFDPDTNMLYLAGKGDCNIRYYEVSSEKPFVVFLNQFRSQLPQKGLGVMPKRGLDVRSGELFRFYRLISAKHLVEPVSMLVERARKPGVFQEDLYPLTAGNSASMTAQQWLSGLNRGPMLMSLRPGTRLANPYPETPPDRGPETQLEPQGCPVGLVAVHNEVSPVEEAFLQEQEAYQDAKYPRTGSDLWAWQPDETQAVPKAYRIIPHCCEPEESPPPHNESQLLQVFYKQQEEIRELREELNQKEEKITSLEMQIRNARNMRTSC